MTVRTAAIGIGLLILLSVACTGGWLVLTGAGMPVLTGLFIGAALGGLNLLLEALSLSWALRRKPSATLLVSLVGFGLRLVLVSVLTIVFARTESIDVVAFAMAYIASFLVFLGLQVWAVSRMQARAGPPAGGDETEDGST